MGAPGADLPGYGASLAWSLVSLALVCLAAYLLLRWLGRKGVGRSDDRVRVLGRCYLEPRRSVYLIEAGSRCFLVGVGEGPMTLLAEIDKAAVPAAPGEDDRPGSSLGQALAKLFGRRRG